MPQRTAPSVLRGRTGAALRRRPVVLVAVVSALLTGLLGPAAEASSATTTMRAPFAGTSTGGYCADDRLLTAAPGVVLSPARCSTTGGADAATGVVDAEARVDVAGLGAGLRTYRSAITATHTLTESARAVDYEVLLRVESAEARDQTTARTGAALATVGVDVEHPGCVGQCGQYGRTSTGPAFLAVDLDGVGAYELLLRPWYRPQVQPSLPAPQEIRVAFRYQRHDGARLPPATVRVQVPVELTAVVGSWTSTMVGGASGWVPDHGSAFARAKLTVTSITATPVP